MNQIFEWSLGLVGAIHNVMIPVAICVMFSYYGIVPTIVAVLFNGAVIFNYTIEQIDKSKPKGDA